MNYTELRQAAKEEYEKDSSMLWEVFSSQEDLRHHGPSDYTNLEDVPLNTEIATLYAIEILKPDDTKSIYVGSYNKPLMRRPGTGIRLNHSGDIGIVTAIKNRHTGKIIQFGDLDYGEFAPFRK